MGGFEGYEKIDLTPAIPSYPKIWGMGHAAIGVITGAVQIEEKVDGSQLSFMKDDRGYIRMRSKSKDLFIADGACSEKMFNKAAETVLELEPLLTPGMIYRCEYLSKPKHNALAYSRVPSKHLVVYDMGLPGEHYMGRAYREDEAARLGLECVPVLRSCNFEDLCSHDVTALLENESFLGGCKIEGVVIKAYGRFGKDGKTVMVKYVSEAFKEKHGTSWKAANPAQSDIVQGLIAVFRNERRWEKAAEHLRDEGALKGELSDIGRLIEHAKQDITVECETEIKDALYKWAMPKILRGATAGLPEWYKQRLLSDVIG